MVVVIDGRYVALIADIKAITPPNLFGIDRRIAYNHKKYHSGGHSHFMTQAPVMFFGVYPR